MVATLRGPPLFATVSGAHLYGFPPVDSAAAAQAHRLRAGAAALPLVVGTGDVHAELVALAPALITSGHSRHYLGFARNQRKLFAQSGELKPLLYAFRVLLTGHAPRSPRSPAHRSRHVSARTSTGSPRCWSTPRRAARCPPSQPGSTRWTTWSCGPA
ncbi:DNA polymerase beta superfamily protein [Actinokineospora guangxiensis]|uniref:DNA polymerase beta superfamily protein n=1 Tax=Actinokineospora guangxiensis TaxID=1490288 RepID=A0ABW0EKE9_9PSEU